MKEKQELKNVPWDQLFQQILLIHQRECYVLIKLGPEGGRVIATSTDLSATPWHMLEKDKASYVG